MTGQKNKQSDKTLNLTGDKQPDARKSNKSGFYNRVLDSAEAIDFEAVTGIEGLDEEITLMRVKIKKLITQEPNNLKLIMQATDMLSKMVKIRYSMTKGQKKGLEEAIKNVINDIGVPQGSAMITENLKKNHESRANNPSSN